MLFLIDFLKKGCELFSLFFSDFFPHYVCAVSPSNLTSCPLPPLNHNAFLKEKKVNKRTIREVCLFSQAFIWMVRVWRRFRYPVCLFFCSFFTYIEHTAHPLTCRVQLMCLTVAVSTPCNSNFGSFSLFHISWLCSSTGSKFLLVLNILRPSVVMKLS